MISAVTLHALSTVSPLSRQFCGLLHAGSAAGAGQY